MPAAPSGAYLVDGLAATDGSFAAPGEGKLGSGIPSDIWDGLGVGIFGEGRDAESMAQP
jgi:hypothetical protein